MVQEENLEIKNIKIPATDGYQLGATLFSSDNANGDVIMISCATGVLRKFYHRYAAYLAGEGFTVVTYDYRGIGESKPLTLNKFKAFMHEWGEKDMAGVINWITGNYPDSAIFAVGHSVAGQVMGLAQNCDRINAMLLVASQSGYWGLWPWHQRYFIWLFWYVAVPFLSIFWSYFPAKILGLGENLPAGVALEWASWGRDQKYVLGNNRLTTKENFKKFSAPIRFYCGPRDAFAPEKSVDELMTFYGNASNTKILLNREKVKTSRFGHFDFFREKFKEMLWQESADWFKENSLTEIREVL